MIIAALVDRIEIGENYEVYIQFKVSAEQFIRQTAWAAGKQAGIEFPRFFCGHKPSDMVLYEKPQFLIKIVLGE